MVGRQLDHYVIQDELGQGGMSVVYRARDTVLQRDVAIKVLHPFLADRPDARRRLAREARAVAKLRHHNILEVYGFSGEDTPQGYIAMELLRGETLKQFGEREKFYPSEVAAAVAWVMAGALAHAHDNGVIHRDVKPENIMIRQDGVLKLMDFGIAHVVDAANLTITGTLQGSPAHMAPEVIEGQDVDARADLFSLGTVLFWMATGQLPFTAKSPHALLKKIVEGRYTEPQRLNAEIPDRLAVIIKRLLARDPDDRYRTAGDLKDALQGVWEEGGLEDPGVSLPLFFKQPERLRTEWAERAATRFIALAEGHLKTGDRVRALASVNRVLALRPEHPAAAALMKNLERRSRTAGRVRIAAAMGAVVAMAGAAVGVASMVEEQKGMETPGVVDTTTGPTLRLETSVTEEKRPSIKNTLRSLTSRPRMERNKDVVLPPPRVEPDPKPVQPVATTPAGPPQKVHLRVDPWADLEVNGTPVGSGKKVYDLELAPGVHRVKFTQKYAQTEEREITVNPGQPTDLAVQLKLKPAHLMVHCEDDPEVFINGVYKGSARESERTPILVPLPNGPSSTKVRVKLVRQGKETVDFERNVTAGEMTDVVVGLRDAQPGAREVVAPMDPPEDP